jgi:DNA-binding NarL/FixJ family response regulator
MPTVFAIHARTSTQLLVREAIAALPMAELAGCTSSAVEAARVIDTLAPDAVTLDALLPDGDGIELAERLRAGRRDLPVILFGPAPDRRLLRAVAVGVCAYMPSAAKIDQTAAVIRGCLTGLASVPSRSLAGALRHDRSTVLSRREREVLQLIRYGLSPTEIAARLLVSESTVKTYMARARAKVGTDSRALGDGDGLPRPDF